jgi:hypothetical protein
MHKKTTWSLTTLSPNSKYFPIKSTITVDHKTKTNKTNVIFFFKNKNKSQNKTNKKLTQNGKYTILSNPIKQKINSSTLLVKSPTWMLRPNSEKLILRT